MALSSQIGQIRDELDELAVSTWHKVETGPTRGLAFGEESITDHNLFELDRVCQAIEVYKFDHREEALNGADFEWYIGGSAVGWIGMRFQAKKLDDGAYLGLGHRVRRQRQYDQLLRGAAADGMWPLYCFYNGWDGPWPPSIRNAVCPKSVAPTRVGATTGCKHADLEHFGCSLVPAGFVASRHGSPRRVGRLALDTYLGQSRPWSHILERPLPCGSGHVDAGAVLAGVASNLRGWFTPEDEADDRQRDIPVAELGRPESDGRFADLPAWLTAVRGGDSGGGGYRPRLALVLDLER
jgi:hypothetical protein